ncbi:MAG: tetratricopeptide repeat protein [Acidobacteriota bacterium]
MIRRFTALSLVAGLCMAALVVAATPAYAQLGSLTGKVFDEAGKPVPDADVMLDFNGEQNFHFTVKTDKNGTWTRAGLIAVGGRWNITAKKGGLSGGLQNVEVALGGAKPVADIVLRAAAGAAGAPAGDPKKAAEAKKVLQEANAALAANDYDTAIAKLTEATTKVDKCTDCFLRLGDVYTKKTDFEKAEAAYKQALTLDEKSADAYDGLAILYNTQKKFDDAGKASAKAIELRAASGGPVDANAAYNSGVIFWNQGKIAEAKEQFSKAVQANPTMAEAQYYYGMCLVNEGKLPDAKAALETYLKLAPTGPNAPTAKSILDSMK